MALFEKFLQLWNQADNEEMDHMAQHVLEFIRFKQLAGLNEEVEKLRKQEVQEIIKSTSWIFFPDSNTRHYRRLSLPWLTFCGRKITRHCIVDLNHTSAADDPSCKSCHESSEIIDYEFWYAECMVDKMLLGIKNPVLRRPTETFPAFYRNTDDEEETD
jgi:hypothetical protein